MHNNMKDIWNMMKTKYENTKLWKNMIYEMIGLINIYKWFFCKLLSWKLYNYLGGWSKCDGGLENWQAKLLGFLKSGPSCL